MVKLSVQYFENTRQIITQFRNKLNDFNTLEINNVPSVNIGFQLIKNGGILGFSNINAVVLKVNDKVDKKITSISKIFINNWMKPVLVSIVSMIDQHESITVWKISENSNLYTIYIDEDKNNVVTDFLHDFLVKKIIGMETGIIASSNQKKSDLNLFDIGDENDNNLLYFAVEGNNLEAVKGFLSKGLDPEANQSSIAIDAAWNKFLSIANNQEEKDRNEKIMALLLNANSRFPTAPKWFEVENLPQEVADFLDKSENLHKLIDQNDFIKFGKELTKNGNLIYYYDRNNQSVFVHGLKTQKYQIISFIEQGLSIGPAENLEEVYDEVEEQQELARRQQIGDDDARKAEDKKKKEELKKAKIQRDENLEKTLDMPDSHIFFLYSKSKIALKDQNMLQKFQIKLFEALEAIDKINYCSMILKVAASWNQLNMFFDCNEDRINVIDPSASNSTSAIAYSNGRVIVGAKELFENLKSDEDGKAENAAQKMLDESAKLSVFGRIIHELCHAAVLLTFRNNFNPYPEGKNCPDKEKYETEVITECEKNQELDWHVKNVLDNYEKDNQPSEFIVTYPQALVEYSQNAQDLQNFQQNFSSLIQYSHEVVEKQLENALSVTQNLQKDTKDIKFDDLTVPLRKKVLNSEVSIKGTKVTIQSLFDEDSEIVNQLTSNSIKEFLLKSVPIEIKQDVVNFSTIVQRTFQDDIQGSSAAGLVELTKDFEQLCKDVRTSKAVVINSFLGSGVTTFLKAAERKLKKDNPGLTVIYFNLSNHKNHFDKFMNKSLDKEQVVKLFSESDLTAEDRAIYLLDGLDQIWTYYGQFWLDVFSIIKRDLKFELWISATPRQTQQIEKIYNIKAVKFAALTDDKIKEFIKIKVKSSGKKYKEAKIAGITEKILDFLKFIETPVGHRSFYESELNNLGLIQDITLMYKDDNINPSNLFEIFSQIEKNLKEKLSKKGKEITIQTVHIIMALRAIFGDNFEHENGFKLQELPIMKNVDITSCWTFDEILDYGMVTLYPDDVLESEEELNENASKPSNESEAASGLNLGSRQLNDTVANRLSWLNHCTKINGVTANFIHKSFAEYFVAIQVTDILSTSSFGRSKKLIENDFKFLEILAKNSEKYSKIRELVFTSNKSIKNYGIAELVAQNLPKMYQQYTNGNNESTLFFGKICKISKEFENIFDENGGINESEAKELFESFQDQTWEESLNDCRDQLANNTEMEGTFTEMEATSPENENNDENVENSVSLEVENQEDETILATSSNEVIEDENSIYEEKITAVEASRSCSSNKPEENNEVEKNTEVQEVQGLEEVKGTKEVQGLEEAEETKKVEGIEKVEDSKEIDEEVIPTQLPITQSKPEFKNIGFALMDFIVNYPILIPFCLLIIAAIVEIIANFIVYCK